MSDIVGFLNGSATGSAGIAQGKEGTTVNTFVISLAAGLILFAVQFGIFLSVRNYLWAKRIYQPRSFLVPVKQRIKAPHPNPLKWLWTVFKIKEDPVVLENSGMDAYFFLRFLSMCLKIFAPIAVVIMPILIPLNVKNGKGTNTIGGHTYNITGLDTLAWSNISPANTDRYWAHCILSIGVIIYVCYIFHEELIHYIIKRQEYLGSPSHILKASSTTVLIQDIPEGLCNQEALEELYSDFPGGIRRIWINRDFTSLVNKDKLRKYYESRIENAETDLLRKIIKKVRKEKKQPRSDSAQQVLDPHGSIGSREDAKKKSLEDRNLREEEEGENGGRAQLQATRSTLPEMGMPTPETCRRDLEHDIETNAAWTKYVAPKHRETMRLPKHDRTIVGKIPLIGRFFTAKVDTIYYCRRALARLNVEIEMEAKTPDIFKQNFSAFVQFNSQKAAHLACQSVADTFPSRMTRRLVEISPGDINWQSLNVSWRSRYLRIAYFLGFFFLMLFVFGIIAFFTGIISRASTLAGSTHWLRWINSLPRWLISFIQGTLPPVIQVIVLSGPLPILLRMLTNRTRGATTGQEGERSLQLWYFIFLLVELFIIPTISSGLTSLVEQLIQSPASIPNLLATYLPTAANYYFSFLIVQALSLSATSILQTIRLFKFYVIGHVNTPDETFEKLSWLNFTRIGSNIPWYITFAVIGLVYSTIAPLMLLFMLLTFSLFWIVIKNNLLYCVRSGDVDGGGLFFPNAINQMFTGLYFMEVCLIGLFFLVRDVADNVACVAQGVIMAIVLVFTILYQIWLMTHLGPLFKYAPIRLTVESQPLITEFHEKLGRRDQPSQALDPISNPIPEDEEKPTTIPHKPSSSSLHPEKATEAQTQSTPRGRARGPTVSSTMTRRPIWTRDSSHRSTSLAVQQRADAASAEAILARLNRPLDETRLAQLEHDLEVCRAAQTGGIAGALLPRRADIEAQMLDDPISRIIMQHNDELENLDPEERDMLISVAFMHPVLRATKPSVWIPRDEEGVSDDEVMRTRAAMRGDVVIDNRGAYFDASGKVKIIRPPPDMSEFALIMAEL